MDLLSAIRGGASLKKAEVNDRSDKKAGGTGMGSSPMAGAMGGGGGIAGVLGAAIAKRRAALKMAGEGGFGEEGDGADDDEW